MRFISGLVQELSNCMELLPINKTDFIVLGSGKKDTTYYY